MKLVKSTKDNIVLLTGIFLPIFLIAFFAIAASLPAVITYPPKHNFLFLTQYYPYTKTDIRFQVKDKRLQVQYRKRSKYSNYGRNQARLYHYNVRTKAVTEILYDIPETDNTKWSTLNPPIQQQLLLNDQLISPDGYEYAPRQYSRGLLGIFRGRRRSARVLRKGGNLVAVEASNSNVNFHSTHFLAWIENE